MTTNISTINITNKNIYGNCDLKCAYNFNYNESNSVATNKGVYISLSYDKGTATQVTYNNQKYFVTSVNIYNGSLHLFDDNYVNSELIIEHAPELGGETLYVCIPIIKSLNNSSASNILGDIIKIVASSAPRESEKISLNMPNFNLNSIVPKKPFFAYTGTEGLKGQVIVFGLNNAIAITSNIMDSITKIVKPYPLTLKGGNLFFNKMGPNLTRLNEGIYISCQPTGSSKEETQVTYENSVNYNFMDLFNNSGSNYFFKILLIIIFFIVLFAILNYGYNNLFSTSNKIFPISK